MCVCVCMTGPLCCTAEIDRYCKSTIIEKIKIFKKKCPLLCDQKVNICLKG